MEPRFAKLIEPRYNFPMKNSLVKSKSRKLAENELKNMRKAEIERAARQKSINKMVQKVGVIIIGNAWQDITSMKANKILVVNQILI